ncbi:MAG: hypothetical protein H6729_14685 [Deltaproteobacteria bacterium]|nr:hypothetical protein [Deltaproteobacteria bacterium]
MSDADIAPPPFLTPIEAMRDIYVRTHSLVSRKTKGLLESPDLDELLRLLGGLHQNEKQLRREEAQCRRSVLAALGPDLGPLVRGLADARLSEPWRLFLAGWDIWQPKGWTDGVELFWEGEAEDDDGQAIEVVQSIQCKQGELTLYVKVGSAEDRVCFDGEAFYRLASDARAAEEEAEANRPKS